MKTMLPALAACALFASGAALACDDLSHHHADVQAKTPDKDVVVTDKVAASQPAAKPAAKQKAPAKSVAQAATVRTVAN